MINRLLSKTSMQFYLSITQDDFRGQFFRIFEIIIFCFFVAICYLVHAVEAMYGLPKVLLASGNLF